MADVPGPELLSMAQQFSGLPMKALIGGPLLAAAQANHQMACDQVKYMMSTCFNKIQADEKAAPSYEPIMVVLKVSRTVITPAPGGGNNTPTITPIESTIELPLLTLLPLNSLAVDNVDVQFEMEVSSSYSQNHEDEAKSDSKGQAEFDAKAQIGPFSVEVKGSVSHEESSDVKNDTHYEKKNSAKYTVAVHAGQLPLPPGVMVIIQAFTQNLSPMTIAAASGPAPAPAPAPQQ